MGQVVKQEKNNRLSLGSKPGALMLLFLQACEFRIRVSLLKTMNKLSEYLEIALAVHAAASIICALTPTRKDDDILGAIYKVLEFLALNIGRTKDR
jgi:hypothetical protein